MAEEKQGTKEKQRMIVGVSGATGLVYAVRALEVLRSLNVETHLVVSRAAELMRSYESALTRKDLDKLADGARYGSRGGVGRLIVMKQCRIGARSANWRLRTLYRGIDIPRSPRVH